MRSFMLISLLVLSILVHEAQGTRLVKASLSARVQKLHERRNEMKRSNGGLEELNLCEDSNCLKSGTNRKLMTKTTSTSSTTTTSKNDKNDRGNKKDDSIPKGQSTTRTENYGGKEENFSANSSPMTERYPDIIDIAGMDYSSARRKPPIHN